MDFRAVFFLQGSRPALMRLIVGSATCIATAGFAPAQSAETVLYSFKGGSDGLRPLASLVFDSKGALYGTTEAGAVPPGNGTVFKLKPPAPGQTQWTERVLYSFNAPGDGFTPVAGLIFDSKGALYGTTGGGGAFNCGTVFQLTPSAPPATKWTEKVLYSFGDNGSDGCGPAAGLIFDGNGRLYGTTAKGGGTTQAGTVFKLKPPAPGQTKWRERVLYSFQGGSDGGTPLAGLVFDSNGALYGTTTENFLGTVFKLTPPVPPATKWTKTVLHSFTGVPDGANSTASLIFNSAGALFGTTQGGGQNGTSFNHGTVFKLKPPAPGQTQWTEKVLYSFKCPSGEILNPMHHL